MSHVIHDWSEEQCLTILANCHRAMPRNAKLLIIEHVLPEGDIFHSGKMLDMNMLVQTPGQERTEAVYRALLEKAHFKLARVVPTNAPVSIVEAVPPDVGRDQNADTKKPASCAGFSIGLNPS